MAPRSRFNAAKLVRSLMKNDKFIEAVAARKKTGLGRKVRQMAGRAKDKKAEEQYKKQRGKGLNLNQIVACCDGTRRDNAIRDNVTIVTLKRSNDKQVIRSRSLTYDRTSGVLKIRPHLHLIEIIPSAGGESVNVTFSKAKRLSVSCDCLVGHTKVLTDKGWKTLLEIAQPYNPGVYSINYMYNGEVYPGTTPYHKGRQPTWSITLSNGQIITATKEHKFLKQKEVDFTPIFSKNKDGIRSYSYSRTNISKKRTWTTLKNLKVGDKIILDNYDPPNVTWNQDFYDAFFIGCMMGDGSLFGNKQEHVRQPDLQLYKHDRLEIINFLKNSNTVADCTSMNTRDGVRVKFNNRAMELMSRYKFQNKKCVQINNREQLLGYLSGLIVTDGSVHARDATICGAYEYLNQLNDFMVQYGYTGTKLWLNQNVGEVTNYQARKKELWTLTITRRTLEHLFDNIWLTNKKQEKLNTILSTKKVNREPSAKILNITYAGRQHVYDITVPEINRFVIDGGIIAHNCEDWLYRWEYAMAKRWGACYEVHFGNGEYPTETNPGLAPGICKHIYVVLKYIKQRGY